MISDHFPCKCPPCEKEINKKIRLEVAFLDPRNYYNSARTVSTPQAYDNSILDIFILSYLIRYGKIKPEYAYYFLKSKKNIIHEHLDNYYYILNKFYNHLNNKF